METDSSELEGRKLLLSLNSCVILLCLYSFERLAGVEWHRCAALGIKKWYAEVSLGYLCCPQHFTTLTSVLPSSDVKQQQPFKILNSASSYASERGET